MSLKNIRLAFHLVLKNRRNFLQLFFIPVSIPVAKAKSVTLVCRL